MQKSEYVFLFLTLFLLAGCGLTSNQQGHLSTNQENNIITFQAVPLHETQQRFITIYNDGEADLIIHALLIPKNPYESFKLHHPPELPFTLKPGTQHNIKLTVAYTAKHNIDAQADLILSLENAENASNEGLFHIKLVHQPAPPIPEPSVEFSCTPLLSFPKTARNTTTTQTCEVHNRGHEEITLTTDSFVVKSGRKEDFSLTFSNQAPKAIIPKGASVTCNIQYSPSQESPIISVGHFVFKSSPTNEQVTLKVKGHVAYASFEAIPIYPPCTTDADCDWLDNQHTCVTDPYGPDKNCRMKEPDTLLMFRYIPWGSTLKRTLRIRALGNVPLIVNGIKITQHRGDDLRLDMEKVTFPLNIPPNTHKDITVEYTPSDRYPDAGEMHIDTNVGTKNVPIKVASHGCIIGLQSKRSTVFSNYPRNFRVENVGNSSCLIRRLYLGQQNQDYFKIHYPTKPNQTIPPKSTMNVVIRYSRTDRTIREGKLILETNDLIQPTQTVTLVGLVPEGSGCEITAKPRALDFSFVPIGQTKTMTISVTNNSWGDCLPRRFSTHHTQHKGHSPFSILAKNLLPKRLRGGETMQVNVQYTPTKVGDEHWVLGIDSNDSRTPTIVLPLSGTTNHPCLLSIPSIVDFGRSSVNCTAQTKTLTIYHSGAEHCPTSIDINAINMNPQTTQAFTITKTPKLPLTVTATKHAQIQVSFRATQAVHQHATIELKTDAKAQPTVSIPIQGKGHATNEEKELFQQRKRPAVDYLFVVADTKSMSFVQQQLTQHIPLFLRSLTQQNIDYRVGVISTDSTTCKDGPPCTEGRAPGCLHGTKSTFITSSTPNAVQLLKQNLLVGNAGSTEPQGLEATYRALTPPTLNDLQCNNGFIRADAALSIIYISNADDVSVKSQTFFEDFFSKQNKQVIVSAIGPSITSGGTCLGSCRYHDLANQTNGYYQDVRSVDWGNMMVQFAKTGIGLRSRYTLSQRPALQTLQVRVNGIVIPRSEQYGWEYDTLTSKIVFSNRAIPSPGATIEIQYKSLCKP